jgi:hypothetical protein
LPHNRRVQIALAALLPHSITPYLLLMIFGFVVGTGGHIARNKVMVAIGIAMIFLATLLLPLAVVATNDTPETGGRPIYAPGTR